MDAIGFMLACRKFFGQKEGQSLGDFKTECDRLSPADKEEVRTGMIANDIAVKPLVSIIGEAS